VLSPPADCEVYTVNVVDDEGLHCLRWSGRPPRDLDNAGLAHCLRRRQLSAAGRRGSLRTRTRRWPTHRSSTRRRAGRGGCGSSPHTHPRTHTLARTLQGRVCCVYTPESLTGSFMRGCRRCVCLHLIVPKSKVGRGRRASPPPRPTTALATEAPAGGLTAPRAARPCPGLRQHAGRGRPHDRGDAGGLHGIGSWMLVARTSSGAAP
jgi:hypothetical protein